MTNRWAHVVPEPADPLRQAELLPLVLQQRLCLEQDDIQLSCRVVYQKLHGIPHGRFDPAKWIKSTSGSVLV